MKNIFLLFLVLPMLFTQCVEPFVENKVGRVEGLRPIYAPTETIRQVNTLPPQPIKQLGKFLYKTPYIFVNEVGRGIHVIDNSDPTQPEKISFIEIAGSRDIAVKGNILYTDNITDLVALDISNLDAVKEVNRVKDLYTAEDFEYPVSYQGHFECVNNSKGTVIGWETALLDNPKCRR